MAFALLPAPAPPASHPRSPQRPIAVPAGTSLPSSVETQPPSPSLVCKRSLDQNRSKILPTPVWVFGA